MKKKSSHLGNLKLLLKQEEKANQQIKGVNKQNIELPKIGVSTSHKNCAKKTLMGAIKNIEEYITLSQKPVPAIVNRCVVALKAQLQLYPSTIVGQVRKTESNQISDNKENEHIYKSQIFNIDKSRLQKVPSKDLFSKVTTVKYSLGDLLNVSEKEVIDVLRNKIKQKDTTIKKLHNHIDDLQGQITQHKEQTKAAFAQKDRQAIKNLALKQELQNNKLKSVNQESIIIRLTSQIKALRNDQKQVTEKCLVLGNQLQQKQAQLLALWQLFLQQRS